MKERLEKSVEDWITTATNNLNNWQPDVFFEELRTPKRDFYASIFGKPNSALALLAERLRSANIREAKPFHIMNIDAPGGCWERGTQIHPELLKVSAPNGSTFHTRTYRFVYLLCNAIVVDDDVVVRHLCNNRACVRPDHLTIGTQTQNILDDRQRKYAGQTPQGRGQALNAHVEKHLQARPDPFVKEPLTRARSSETPGEFD